MFKYKKDVINKSKDFLTGDILFSEYINFLIQRKNWKYVYKYSCKHMYACLPDVEYLINVENKYMDRIKFYCLIKNFLFENGIVLEKYNLEFNKYLVARDLLPEWFDSDYETLLKMFPNLDELIKNKKLKKEIRKICKTTAGFYPEWLQNPEWPIENNIPLVFIGQSVKIDDLEDDFIDYYFENPITNEKITITQYD